MRITDHGLEYEADPRHVELMVESLGLRDGKSVVSPGVKNPDPAIETLDKVDELGETAAGTKMGNTATQIGESGETTTGKHTWESGETATQINSLVTDRHGDEQNSYGAARKTADHLGNAQEPVKPDTDPTNIQELLCTLTTDNDI